MNYHHLNQEIKNNIDLILKTNQRTYTIKTHGTKIHFVRILPRFFALKLNGFKDWEFRENDRNYSILDLAVYLEWDPEKDHTTGRGYTGRYNIRIITHIEDLVDHVEHWVIFSDKNFNEMDTITLKKKEDKKC